MKVKQLLTRFLFRTVYNHNKFLRECLKGMKNMKILDIGTGSNQDKGYYRRSLKFFSDPSNIIKETDIVGRYEYLDINNSDIKEEYDVIFCVAVLEHIFDFKKAVNNIHKALKGGGWGFLTVPANYPLHDEPHDYWRFTRNSLKMVFKDFKEIEIKHSGFEKYPFNYFIKVRK